MIKFFVYCLGYCHYFCSKVINPNLYRLGGSDILVENHPTQKNILIYDRKFNKKRNKVPERNKGTRRQGNILL